MKKLLYLFLPALVLAGCQDNSKPEEKKLDEDPLFGMDFRNYNDLDALANYEKKIDTSVFMGGLEDDYRLLNLQEDENNLVLFYKVAHRDSVTGQPVSFRVIDTLQTRQLKEDERISVGYCYHEDYYEGELVALVRESDSLLVANVLQVWRANPESESLEALEDFEGITCLNEAYEGEQVSLKHLDLQSRKK